MSLLHTRFAVGAFSGSSAQLRDDHNSSTGTEISSFTDKANILLADIPQ